MGDALLASFTTWYKANGGHIDQESVSFKTFAASEGGRGLVAVKDIQEGHALFTVPRHLILSTRTSQLPSLVGLQEWKNAGLDQGWSGLILCMMWEQANGPPSKWHEYLAILPDHFHTPMFWEDEDMEELQGTAVVEKIGKDEAEKEYAEKVFPVLQSRPDLFPPDSGAANYSLAVYHMMGSRILSRSFQVEHWEGALEEGEDKMITEDTNGDVGGPVSPSERADVNESSRTGEDGDSTDVAMVPMADMLNARFRSENSKLFHEKDCLKMIATKPIKAGDQIWNTYGDLPNAELLRRYGHIDMLPLPQGDTGNPGDVVEIKADLVVDAAIQHQPNISSGLRERIDWWLEEGGDDVIVIESDYEIPPILLSLIRLFLMPESEWENLKAKSKPPKAKMEHDTLNVLITALHKRLTQYRTSLEEDKELMQQVISVNKMNAIGVRMGEKRILKRVLDNLETLRGAGGQTSKRKRLVEDGGKLSKKGNKMRSS